MINLLLIMAFPFFSFATQDACEMLSHTLRSQEPMIEKATELKARCEFEIRNGVNAKLTRLLSTFDLKQELVAAHTARVEERLGQFADFKAILSSFRSDWGSVNGRKDLKAANSIVMRAAALLDSKLQFFISTQNSRLEEYYSKKMVRTLDDIRELTTSSDRKDHKTLQFDLNKEVASFKSISDVQVNKLNNLLVSEMRKVNAFISFKKVDLLARADDDAMASFTSGLAALIDKVEAAAFWNAYVSKSKLMQRIEGAERRVALGMIQTAIDDYGDIEEEIKAVLAKLSSKSSDDLMNGAAGLELKRIEKRIFKLRSYPTSKAFVLLRESMKISVNELEQKKVSCFSKLPALSPIYAEFKDRYTYFMNFRLEGLSEKDQKLTVKLSESTQAQFDLLRSACAKGKL